MKRITAIILLTALMLGVFSCGGQGENGVMTTPEATTPEETKIETIQSHESDK